MDPQATAQQPSLDKKATADSAAGGVDTVMLARRLHALRTDRSNVQQMWDQIDRYENPLGSLSLPYSTVTEQVVRWNRFEVWDSTAIESSEHLSASIHSAVTNPSSPWSKWVWRQDKLKEDPESASWLEKAGEAFHYELVDSDFTPEIQSCYGDLVRPGNTFMMMEPGSDDPAEWKGFDFTAIPLREGFFEEDSKGGIYRFFRWLSWTPIQVHDLCLRHGWDTPVDILEKTKSEQGALSREEICFCVFPREEKRKELERRRRVNRERNRRRAELKKKAQDAKLRMDEGSLRGAIGDLSLVDGDEPLFPLAAEERPFGAVYFRAGSGEKIGTEFGYYEMPAFFCPWEKTTGSRWGHGRGVIALPTVKGLNAWQEADFTAAEKVVDPMWGVTELGLISDLNNEPGGIVVMRSKDDVWIMESKAAFPVTHEKIQGMQAMVRRLFYADELQLKDSPQMTAMEAQIRYELMQRILGAPLNRIETNLLGPIQRVGFGMMLRAGRLPEPPALVKEALTQGLADVSIEYLGPLARSQRTDKVASIERLLAFALSLLKGGLPLPVVMAVVDMPTAIREMAKYLGTPNDLLKAKEKVEEALKALQEQAQRAAEADISAKEGEAKKAHADAAMAMQTPPGGPTNIQPTPAQPGPLVAPAFGAVAPFQQPSAPPLG